MQVPISHAAQGSVGRKQFWLHVVTVDVDDTSGYLIYIRIQDLNYPVFDPCFPVGNVTEKSGS